MQLTVALECTAKLNGNGYEYEYGYELEMPKKKAKIQQQAARNNVVKFAISFKLDFDICVALHLIRRPAVMKRE